MKYAVVDSGPIIKGVRLETVGAERLITVPEVLLEIRDRHARDRLAAMPFELETREPSSEATEAVRHFAKLTGDLPALSSVDLRVLALSWQLEKETKGGVQHLRSEPLPPGSGNRGRDGGETRQPDGAASTGADVAGAGAGATSPDNGSEGADETGEAAATAAADAGMAEDVEDEDTAAADDALLDSLSAQPTVDISDDAVGAAWSSSVGGEGIAAVASASDGERQAALEARRAARERAEAAETAALNVPTAGGGSRGGAGTSADGEEEPWITVDNLKAVQQRDGQKYAYAPDASTTVACLTTDYAMQSVLMQMGLHLLGADGMLLRSVKQWVLRCSGCYTQQGSLEAQFCSKCGNNSLVRLQAVLNNRGQQRILPEQRAPARVRSTNVRGTKFPMPQPKSGRHAHNLILAEDQLAEATEKARRQGKARVEDVFDPDYSLDDHFGRAGNKRGGRGPSTAGMPKVGYGKRANPNDVRSRPKRT
mmetsp:Transcript_18907/g.48335  ORF Transcript_18907/g.48335 Transcript_18907/m.48335 type:complete len:482 (-) Transcript_18907:321-1766(-)